MTYQPVRFEGTPEMAHFLLQQRTEYGVFSTQGLNVKPIMKRYRDDMVRTFQTVQPYLPREASEVLDIGGGLGGMSVMLGRHYPAAKVTLLEREGDEGSKIGWHDSAEEFGAYNSAALTSEFLTANGLEDFAVVDAANGYPLAGPYQVVISLLSLGFHYPVETYLNAIYASLEKGGVFICDIRNGTKGELACTRMFENCAALAEGKKHTTYGFRKL